MLAVVSNVKKEIRILLEMFRTNWHIDGYTHLEVSYSSLHVTSKSAVA
jgi:hypothetical protein